MAGSEPRRRPKDGGYARGDAKRILIIEAALRRFGADGYAGASTRQIAADAGVNPPALQYYFGGKEGLYRACGTHLAEQFAVRMAEPYRRAALLERAPDTPDPRADAFDMLLCILDCMLDLLFDVAEDAGWTGFLRRHQVGDDVGPADRVLRSAIQDALHDQCGRLVARITGETPDGPETQIRTTAIIGQFATFHAERDAVLRRIGWPDFRGARLQLLKTVLRRHTAAALAGDAPMPPAPGPADHGLVASPD